MKKSLLGLVLLVLGTSFVTRDAHAVEAQSDPLIPLTILGVGALDLGLATADLVIGAHEKWAPRVYGGFETALAGAQLGYFIDKGLGSRDQSWEFAAGFVAILTAHGIATLVAPRSSSQAPAEPGPLTVAPLALSDISRAAVPGMAVLGRF